MKTFKEASAVCRSFLDGVFIFKIYKVKRTHKWFSEGILFSTLKGVQTNFEASDLNLVICCYKQLKKWQCHFVSLFAYLSPYFLSCHVTRELCNICFMQHVHYGTCVLCNTFIMQHVHYATRALFNTCIMQDFHYAIPPSPYLVSQQDKLARWTG